MPLITFLSDYGLQDEFVGVCHAVIVRICPPARVIDLSHSVPRHDARTGALMLQAAVPYAAADVHLAIVDPDVGAQRRAIALRSADGPLFVGPDNGLLGPAAEACGGVLEAVDISGSPLRLEPVSATFHGRDIFAPVAAALAAGARLEEAGTPVDPAELVALELPRAHRHPEGSITTHALLIDRFGNIALDLTHAELDGSGLKLGRGVSVEAGSRCHQAQFARTFADVPAGALLLYEDAQRRLALAVSRGDAAARLGVSLDDELCLRSV